MEHLSVSQVAELLQKEGFPEDVVHLFAENEIDGKALMMLETDENMKEVGLTRLEDLLRIKRLLSRDGGATLPPVDDNEKELVRK